MALPLPLGGIKDPETRIAFERISQHEVFRGGAQTATVASAASITLSKLPLVTISGTADITSITAGTVGQRVTLLFSGNAAATGVTDGSNLVLAGNFAYTTNDTMDLISDGTNWYEVGRSVN